jgi:hypothetical protein
VSIIAANATDSFFKGLNYFVFVQRMMMLKVECEGIRFRLWQSKEKNRLGPW